MNKSPIAARVCVSVFLYAAPAGAATIAVAAGGNLQQATNDAAPGDTIALAPGATFSGTFTLPVKNNSGDAMITLRTAGDDRLPGDGERISAGHAGALAIIRPSGSGAA